MKQIPKKEFDEVLRLSRDFWESGDPLLVKDRIAIAQYITNKTGIDWMAICDFIDCLIRRYGFLPGASNEMLYILLRVLGWEVADVEVNTTD